MKKKTLTALLLPVITGSLSAETVGFWRFDEASAADGQPIEAVPNLGTAGTVLDATVNGGALYSTNVPFAEIEDPVSGEIFNNAFSYDASAFANSMTTVDDEALNSSFTVEFFILLEGEPSDFERFVGRVEAPDLRWQVDFGHGSNFGYGGLRGRFDTPSGGVSDGLSEMTDENFNFLLQGANDPAAAKIFVDTGLKDIDGDDVGPQNTNNPEDYVANPDSLIPSETDPFLQGDGANDGAQWFHVALTFDEDTQEASLFIDQQLVRTRTLSDAEGDGYTHPAAGFSWGRFGAVTEGLPQGLLFDEIRYSNEVLSTNQFLRERLPLGPTPAIVHYRFEDDAADAGDVLSDAGLENVVGDDLDATTVGSPLFSDDVPGPQILDPVTRQTVPNLFSMDVSGENTRIDLANDEVLNTDFTVELFMRIPEEPGGFHSFVRRSRNVDGARSGWQIDFDHGNMGSFGRIRGRFDPFMQAENQSFGPQGGANLPASGRIWVDTDPGDNDVASYNDPADWFLDGDGINDNSDWHHVAMSFDTVSQTVRFYYDYELVQTRILTNEQNLTYTHPDDAIRIGKLVGEEYGLLMDEFRFSPELLEPAQFLVAIQEAAPQPRPVVSLFLFFREDNEAEIEFEAMPETSYLFQRSATLRPEDFVTIETITNVSTEVETLGALDANVPADADKLFYRVVIEEAAEEMPEETDPAVVPVPVQ